MIDVVYVVTTIAFFVTMLLYVVACDRLGRATDVETGDEKRAAR